MKRIAKFAVVAFSLFLSFNVCAAEKKLDPALQATNKEKFEDRDVFAPKRIGDVDPKIEHDQADQLGGGVRKKDEDGGSGQ